MMELGFNAASGLGTARVCRGCRAIYLGKSF